MSASTAAARVNTRPVPRPAARERPQQPRLRVVAPSTHRSATGLALLCVALLGAGLLALLLLNISIGKGAYTLTKLQTEQRQLAENQQALAEQVDAVSAPQELAASARKLGMVPAPNPVFVRLSDGRIEGTPAIAKAAPKPKPKPKPTAKAGSAAKAGTPTKTSTPAKKSAKSATGTVKSPDTSSAKVTSPTVKSAAKQQTAVRKR